MQQEIDATNNLANTETTRILLSGSFRSGKKTLMQTLNKHLELNQEIGLHGENGIYIPPLYFGVPVSLGLSVSRHINYYNSPEDGEKISHRMKAEISMVQTTDCIIHMAPVGLDQRQSTPKHAEYPPEQNTPEFSDIIVSRIIQAIERDTRDVTELGREISEIPFVIIITRSNHHDAQHILPKIRQTLPTPPCCAYMEMREPSAYGAMFAIELALSMLSACRT